MSSMRSRSGAASRRTRSGIRAVYEDFKPSSEWKHEDGVSVLLFNLPGFVKEQIRIIAESRGILRVRGERFLSGNKWSRFQEEVVVPEDCNMSEIRAKFEGGILRITMPTKVTPTDHKHPSDEQSTQTTEPPTSSVPSPNEPPKPQGFEQPEPPSKPPALPPVAQPPPIGGSLASPPFVLPPRGSESEKQPQKFNETNASPLKPPNVSQNNAAMVRKEHQNIDSSKENEHKKVGAIMHKKDEDVYADAVDQGQEQSSLYDLNKIDKFGNPLLKRLDEDRQLLMNMGVAVLVIVALGAHIAYSFAPTE